MCGCSKNVPTVAKFTPKKAVTTSADCSTSREEVEATKASLLSIKTPSNFVTINNAIGLLDTMLNTGNYCVYKLENIYANNN